MRKFRSMNHHRMSLKNYPVISAIMLALIYICQIAIALVILLIPIFVLIALIKFIFGS